VFKASLDYTVRPSLKKKKKKNCQQRGLTLPSPFPSLTRVWAWEDMG
jgi:hypothetical protein